MNTSPEPARGRVIRGGTASRASALAFPTIETVDPPDHGVPTSSTSTFPTAVRAPAVDPAELERARLEAAARGYADGLAAGRDEARADVQAQARGLLQSLADAAQDLHAREVRTFDELTGDVVDFALAVVESILGRELATATSPACDAVRSALRLAPDRASAIVLLHPDDVEAVSTADDVAGPRSIEIVADSTVAPGSCVVRAGESEVDARIDAALARLRVLLTTGGGNT
jgi:flagellar assembly protein FliH